MPLRGSAHHERAGKGPPAPLLLPLLLLLSAARCRHADRRRLLPGTLLQFISVLCHAVQMPEHGRDPDEIMHILEDWTDMQLEGFFK